MTIDLEHTLQAYGPNGKIARLLFIADRDPTLRIECYMHSLRELLETPNVERYQAIHSKLNAELVTQGLAPVDLNVEYISKTVAENQQKQQRLEQELKSYTSNFIRESIRIGHLELAEFYYSIGDLQNSLKYYSNSREFCTTQSHVLECCLKVVELSLEMDNNQNVSAYLQRGNQALNPNPQGNATSSTSTVHSSLAHRLTLLAGIHCLDNGNYRQCAREFKQLPFTTESMWQFLNPRDVAIYGAICMLATFSRQELKESMENVEFKQYLELEPRIREILRQFYSCDYKNAFKMLNEFKVWNFD